MSDSEALHHACASQCEPATIHALLRSPAGAVSARAQDVRGRLPLHLLAKSFQPSRKHRYNSQKQIAAQAKDEAALTVNVLQHVFGKSVYMLTGDNYRTARAVAHDGYRRRQ